MPERIRPSRRAARRLVANLGWESELAGESPGRRARATAAAFGTLLRALIRDVRLAGGQFLIRDFGSVSEVLALPEPVIFNCTGLGAAALFALSLAARSVDNAWCAALPLGTHWTWHLCNAGVLFLATRALAQNASAAQPTTARHPA